MPLYMDIHTVDSNDFSVEDVVKAHMEDLAIQEKFGVIQMKYWVNVDAKTLFCLMEGPSKEACNKVHEESHGNTACNIIEVSDDEFNLFLGQGTDVNDLAHTNSGEIDTGYRTLILIDVNNYSTQSGLELKEVYNVIERHNGSIIIQPNDDILVSFIFAADAIQCAKEIADYLDSIPNGIEFIITLVSGRPVDETGNDLFEETKKRVEYSNAIGSMNKIHLGLETKKLAEKERLPSKIDTKDFSVMQHEDVFFLIQLCESIDQKLHDPNFKSDDLNTMLGLSKSQTYRKIKSLTGVAPNQIIQEVRMRKSLKCIRQKSKTIAETAFELGFNSPTYFTKVFRKRFNITPTFYSNLTNT